MKEIGGKNEIEFDGLLPTENVEMVEEQLAAAQEKVDEHIAAAAESVIEKKTAVKELVS